MAWRSPQRAVTIAVSALVAAAAVSEWHSIPTIRWGTTRGGQEWGRGVEIPHYVRLGCSDDVVEVGLPGNPVHNNPR
ncbi:hypothetical protein DL93DRAFT_2084912 [Clavulina sp. PMI_390]|nr:hypothetical protein DL93DRAFT_2084912 [Clavulina sp. PMI_390]